ncbi:VOC family protein [bacterium]|nr:VOC family protein [bacterium]
MGMIGNRVGRMMIWAMMLGTLATGAWAQGGAKRRIAPDAVDSSDVVRGRVEPVGNRFFIGQPVVLRVTLSNHSREYIHVSTNFIPQSNLTVDIQGADGKRPYTGPYAPGRYPSISIPLMPFDESSENVVIWSDPTQPMGLAFNKPGDYVIELSLTINIDETGKIGKVPLNKVAITVEDTPPQLKAMVDQLAKMKAFEKLQQHQVPKPYAEDIEMMLTMYPPNAIFPYIFYALAGNYTFEMVKNPERHDAIFETAFKYYQIAAQSDSAFKIAIYQDLLRLLDHENKSKAATAICRLFIKQMPPELRGKVGGVGTPEKQLKETTYLPQFLKKYLINTPELDRGKYWNVLN